jgi:hypothetical protein
VSSVDELPIGTVTFLFTDIEGSTQPCGGATVAALFFSGAFPIEG